VVARIQAKQVSISTGNRLIPAGGSRLPDNTPVPMVEKNTLMKTKPYFPFLLMLLGFCKPVLSADLLFTTDDDVTRQLHQSAAITAAMASPRTQPHISASISGILNPQLLGGEHRELYLALPNRAPVLVMQQDSIVPTTVNKAEKTPARAHTTWNGRVADKPHSSVLLTTYKGLVNGRIAVDGRVYEIRQSS
jgi:hypothetical protein